VHGSGTLIRWLLDNDLVDEINLLTFPVVVGQGTRLFPDTGPDRALELVESRATPRGVTIQVLVSTIADVAARRSSAASVRLQNCCQSEQPRNWLTWGDDTKVSKLSGS
jgi:hypothetical protein